jgi:hypothetical protein
MRKSSILRQGIVIPAITAGLGWDCALRNRRRTGGKKLWQWIQNITTCSMKYWTPSKWVWVVLGSMDVYIWLPTDLSLASAPSTSLPSQERQSATSSHDGQVTPENHIKIVTTYNNIIFYHGLMDPKGVNKPSSTDDSGECQLIMYGLPGWNWRDGGTTDQELVREWIHLVH